ncbi:putative integral membrane protein [Corynebacterium mustelae]|uniref:Putative integral membrane protein n=2 Tax=Corynebacterium mustelae TaxID=571915 RepID=A0A0G3H0E6_9CORY|nr:lipopolysaccharide assembly protein LapA domain-containing protein [Corynebacterium mustelae]AKK06220.1 putative integral membrane protein [Corynebacterium mustelae]
MSKNNDDFHSDALAHEPTTHPDAFSDNSVHEYEPSVDNLPAEVPAATTPAAKPAVKSSFAGGTWVALIAGALLLIVLLVFILQNQQPVDLTLFAWSFTFPAGVGFLLAAIAGALIMALVGGVRMLQLRRQIKKN